jgi:CheY-like chemotaxis protein/HPt (histidine-containing phosphotransfer) domain-containing protein
VEDELELFSELAHRKGLELIISIQDDVPNLVNGDPDRLRQVLSNLIGNAIKFTDTGEVIVGVSKVEAQEEVVIIQFEVKDTGIGIRSDDQSRVFDYFDQADGSTTRQYGGTGLGLAISKELVTMMGGKIGLDSSPGHGSTFWFTVRLGRRSSEEIDQMQWPNLEGTRILIVASNPTSLEVLRAQLISWRLSPSCCDNPERACEILRDAVLEGQPFQMAMLDMNSDEINGSELAQLIKSDPSLSSIHLIALTSICHQDDLQQAEFTSWIRQPYRKSQLWNVIVGIATEGTNFEQKRGEKRSALSDVTFQGSRVLVAEDNQVNQVLAREMLKALGCATQIVPSGVEAIKVFKEGDYDLILMDCQMPRMDGFETTQKIRELEEIMRSKQSAQRVPIVALTAHAMKGDRERCLAAGMDDYLSKPFKQSDLAEVLDRWLVRDQAVNKEETDEPEAETREFLGRASFKNCIERRSLEELKAVASEASVSKVLNLFLEDSPKILSRLDQSIREANPQGLLDSAHYLKSSSATIGASNLSGLCQELEAMGHSQELQDARTVFSEIQREYQAVEKSLQEELQRLPAPPGDTITLFSDRPQRDQKT